MSDRPRSGHPPIVGAGRDGTGPVPGAPGYDPAVADVTHIEIEEMDSISGFFEGIAFYKAAAGLGVSSFGVSIIDMAPGADEYPEHDHSEEGIGGRMFAERPQQLGQEEVYFALRGSGTVEADDESYPIDVDHALRVGPAVRRKVLPGPDGIRLLAIGGRPGEAYETGGAL
jgi:mannose-6-phosphate isomerase-like protein (cupin superfamily)